SAQALELFRSIEGSSRAASVNLAQLLLKEGQAAEALQLLQPLAESDPEDPELLTIYGHALAGTGARAEAEAAYEAALSIDGEFEPARQGVELLHQQADLSGEGEAV